MVLTPREAALRRPRSTDLQVKVIRMGEKTRGEYQHDILSYIAARERHRAGEVSDEELARLRQLAVEARAAGIKSPPFE
jgi:hypothetical protein